MRCALRVTILKENTAVDPRVQAGHGLSLLVECGPTRLLLDTGPDATVVANARALGLALSPLAAIVLSHGHYDHTGGLAAVLAEVGPTRVVAHPRVFDQTYAQNGGEQARYIGPPLSQSEYEARGARFELSASPVRLAEDLITTREIPQEPAAVPADSRLLRQGPAGVVPDSFRDDLSLVALLPTCSVVITGCGHAGLLNILRQVQVVAPGRRPRVVMGGLHLGATSDDAVAALATEAYRRGVRTLLPCHCAGERATEVLRERFPGTVMPVGTGTEICVRQDGKPTIVVPGGSPSPVGTKPEQSRQGAVSKE
jgi:7,8-dihydropterin-6-yl-methyl-4-(beta-D-ribofuranosyl)aminobenzene 5'-phosphate synthase